MGRTAVRRITRSAPRADERRPDAVQLGLFTAGPAAPDCSFGNLTRHRLAERSWVEHAPGWLAGSDEVWATLAERVEWRHGRRRMYDQMVDEPRLTQSYGRSEGPFPHPALVELFDVLSARYGAHFDSVGLNFYRDGADSVAWHGDRVARTVPEPLVAIVSVGEPRPFLLRPAGGGRSRAFNLGSGDLLVMGGDCQRELEHSVPKVALAGPRISITYRHSTPAAASPAQPVAVAGSPAGSAPSTNCVRDSSA
ncbi:MAG: alpha-ketoglutarate-dependent dioxygenase AlkB [Acidimicrobiia bacterium]|nr:alpha-ketoglutarate-dependent dioxygenase AlkB [Acidimicrobiia bacterium]